MAQIIAPGHLARQREWSQEKFGPGTRTKGVAAHVRKELDEVEADSSGREWVDVLILAIDGLQRSGLDPIAEYHAKMEENYSREWPDWRNYGEDEAIEHVRVSLSPPAVPDNSHLLRRLVDGCDTCRRVLGDPDA